MSKFRVAIAGFQHETNTFAPGQAGVDEFRMADSWPALLRGRQVINDTRGMNLPITGAIQEAELSGQVELIPIVWCSAEPSGPVTSEAFDWICDLIAEVIESRVETSPEVDGLAADGLSGESSVVDSAGGSRSAVNGSIIRDPEPNGTTISGPAGGIDAIYLDLHGAMVTDTFEDGEGELLRRLRKLQPTVPIAVSLDLHANVSPQLVQLASVISIYRTYPHLDMALTGTRCMQRLLQVLRGNSGYHTIRQVPFLVPLHAQCTSHAPCRDLYESLDTLTTSDDEHVELAMGFTAADIFDCGPAIVASANSASRAETLADTLLQQFCDREADFDSTLMDVDRVVAVAMANSSNKPVVIADVQDNAGAGGTSDTTGLLQALIDYRADNSVVGVICDAEVAALAHRHKAGDTITCALGAKAVPTPGNLPVNGQFSIERLSDGNIPYTGDMYRGSVACIGPSCLLALSVANATLRVVVSSCRTQCLDQALFTHFGIDLRKQRIIGVKSTVHFRADFESLAGDVIPCKAPGSFACDLSEVQYAKLRPGVRTHSVRIA